MTKEKDVVVVPNDWLPPSVLTLISKSNKIKKSGYNFYTDDLDADGDNFFINKDGFLIHENTEMSVVSNVPEYNNGDTSLVIDVTHTPVVNHKLKKLYSHIMNKLCILVVKFKENRIVDIKSIIKPCTQ
jgi:hypothetical protein